MWNRLWTIPEPPVPTLAILVAKVHHAMDTTCHNLQEKGSLSGTNAWARWTTCQTCALRLQYIPRTGAPGHRRSAGPLPKDVENVITEKKNDVVQEDLVTKAVAINGAEKSLIDRLAQVQKQKESLKKPVEKKTDGYQSTPPNASKKAVKREGAVAAEIQEKETVVVEDETWVPVSPP